jgi:3-phenylpropionate/cinnamic acid dioxygenase small subunit
MSDVVANAGLRAEVEDFIALEVDHIDRRRWQDWLALFTEDAVFWVPAWRNEDTLVENPTLELNLIYLRNRGMLEDRVFRFTSGDSYASTPLPTTSHVVSNIRLTPAQDGQIGVSAKAIIVSVHPRRGAQLRGAWYDYTIVRDAGGGLRIARKKITLLEQVIDGTVDIYSL